MTVSVLIPAYNAGAYIAQCLRSIVEQSYSDLQICVIDDGSTDSTAAIIKTFADGDGRIVFKSRSNKGVASTRNELLDLAKGEFTLFVDADDWIETDMIENLVCMVVKNEADIAMCDFSTNNGTNISVRKDYESTTIWDKSRAIEKFLVHREMTGSLCNKLVKTSLLHDTRFATGIAYGEDAMVMWDVVRRIGKMAVTQNQYYHYRMNPTSVSHQGLTPAKMTSIKVWDYICDTISPLNKREYILARARRGAEMTLLLLSAIRKYTVSNQDLSLLRKVVRKSLPAMYASHTLSPKFMAFAITSAICWPIAKVLVLKY